MPNYSIRTASADILFIAAHFITFEGGGCEPLHGHDYRVQAELFGPLGANEYLVDFVLVKECLLSIVKELDHCTLLPGNHPAISVVRDGEEYVITHAGRRWVLPQDNCRILPIANTTTEMFAGYIAQRLIEQLKAKNQLQATGVVIEVGECDGFSGSLPIGSRRNSALAGHFCVEWKVGWDKRSEVPPGVFSEKTGKIGGTALRRSHRTISMSKGRLRRRVAFEAARLIYEREEPGHRQAKRKAAKRFRGADIHRRDLPSDREIRAHIGEVARMIEEKRQAEPSPFGPRLLDSPQLDNAAAPSHDRFRIYELLLWPLENVKESVAIHPEGDALYHSLQVFELAREAIPYDEEFLLAALLHDVGKAIDPRDHVAAGLEALDGFDHRADRVVDRAPHRRPVAPRRDARRALPPPVGSRRRLRGTHAAGRVRSPRPCDRRNRCRSSRVARLSSRLGGAVRRVAANKPGRPRPRWL